MTKQPINIALVHVYLKCKIEVLQAGTIELRVPQSAAMWIDGRPIDGETSFTADLPAGQHEVIVRLDARGLPETFRLESQDVAFVNR